MKEFFSFFLFCYMGGKGPQTFLPRKSDCLKNFMCSGNCISQLMPNSIPFRPTEHFNEVKTFSFTISDQLIIRNEMHLLPLDVVRALQNSVSYKMSWSLWNSRWFFLIVILSLWQWKPSSGSSLSLNWNKQILSHFQIDSGDEMLFSW